MIFFIISDTFSYKKMTGLETIAGFHNLGLSESHKDELLRLDLVDAVAVLVEAKTRKYSDDDCVSLPVHEIMEAVLEDHQNETPAARHKQNLYREMFEHDDVIMAQHSAEPCEGALLLAAAHAIDALVKAQKLPKEELSEAKVVSLVGAGIKR